MGSVGALRRFLSCAGIVCQEKCRLHQKPPTELPPTLLQRSVSAEMMSISGQTTALRFSLIRANIGSNLIRRVWGSFKHVQFKERDSAGKKGCRIPPNDLAKVRQGRGFYIECIVVVIFTSLYVKQVKHLFNYH